MLFFTKLLIFASAALVPQAPFSKIRAAEQTPIKTPLKIHSCMQLRRQDLNKIPSVIPIPLQLFITYDVEFSISHWDNAEAPVMIWSRKGDPKVSRGKPMYHSPAAIFTAIDEPSGSSKNKLLHFTVQWRGAGLCVERKLRRWPTMLPQTLKARPTLHTWSNIQRHNRLRLLSPFPVSVK